jgi:transcriptional regulator with XRE-family HTH domain
MSTRDRTADKGARRARSVVTDLGEEIRRARLDHGLSQADVARAAKTSRAQVGRIERAAAPTVSILQMARLLAVLGLELSARAYPAGQPIRDAAHRALIERLRARVSPSVAWRFEVPLGQAGDQRAWDVVLLIGTAQFAVEAETRPRDVQALQRRVSLKRRDDPGVSGVLLLLAATRHNGFLLREHGPALRADFPTPAAEILRALGEGRVPGGSGILLL